MGEVTELLSSARGGSPPAWDKLFDLLYPQLRTIAHARLRQRDERLGLDTTALVHETYLRLLKLQQLTVTDRPHFLAYASRVMRSVIVDMVREQLADCRGGGQTPQTLDTAAGQITHEGAAEVLRVHEALEVLAQVDERLVRVVEMRYFVGLNMAEIADALGVAVRTVERDWEKARSFLYAQLSSD